MFWIYIPPIVFIAALVALVVILGKKTASLKNQREVLSEKKQVRELKAGGEKWYKRVGIVSLRILEKILFYIKIGAKKLETVLADMARKIKEKRTGRKSLPLETPEERIRQLDIPEENFHVIEREAEKKDSLAPPHISSEITYVSEEVVIKRKPEIVPRRAVPEAMPEDKVREDALIHRIAENPRDIEAYRELGDYYLAVGNIKDAKDSFKMVLKLRPRDLKAKSSLREIELKMRLKS